MLFFIKLLMSYFIGSIITAIIWISIYDVLQYIPKITGLLLATLSSAFVFLIILIIISLHKNSILSKSLLIFDAILSILKTSNKKDVSYTKDPFESIMQEIANIDVTMQENTEKVLKNEKFKVELITNVTHDLKTPLTAIIGYSSIMAEIPLSNEAQSYAKKINRKAIYLGEILEDVLDLSKVSTGNIAMNLNMIDVIMLLHQTLAEMNDQINSSGFTIIEKNEYESIMALVDGQRLYRVFQNLIDNSLKYSMKGTRIFIIINQTPNKYLNISFINTSSYNMEFNAEDIVKRFIRGNSARTGEGSGIGLAIAKIYTEACNGKFDINIKGDQFEAIVCLPIN